MELRDPGRISNADTLGINDWGERLELEVGGAPAGEGAKAQ